MPCRAPDRINFLDGSLAYRKNDISSKLLAETRSSISIGVVNKICRDKLSYNDLIIYIYIRLAIQRTQQTHLITWNR
jgi:hypothetical protein